MEYGKLDSKKTKNKVSIAIVGKLKEILDRRMEENKPYLFCNKYGNRLKPIILTHWFIKLRAKAAKKHPEFSDELLAVQFRDIRAKAGTDKFLSSDTESAQKQLGHTNAQMTRRYIRRNKIVQPTKL